MIMIDDNKTVIAGEAIKIMTELATVLDRLLAEVSQKTGTPLEYEVILDRFMNLVSEVKEIRDAEGEEINPNQIIDSNKIRKIFPEEFFELRGHTTPRSGRGSEKASKDNSKSTSALLKDAMRKLDEAKKAKKIKVSEDKKKSKKSKKSKKDK